MLNAIENLSTAVPFPTNYHALYKAIYLFCGIGGTRLGFHLTSQEQFVISSLFKTYSANYSETPVGDITKLDSN